MEKFPFKRLLGMGVLCAGSALLFSACMDDSYDLDNVDLTMGLGSDGLSVKMGNTEKIYLEDILSVDESVKLDNANLYYLVEDGSTDFFMRVNNVNVRIDGTTVGTHQHVLSLDDAAAQGGSSAGAGSLWLPQGTTLAGQVEGSSNMSMTVSRVGADIKRLSEIGLNDTPIELRMRVVQTNNMRLSIDHLQNFTIKLPDFLRVKSVSGNWKLNGQELTYLGNFNLQGSDYICTLVANNTVLGSHGTPQNGSISLPAASTEITMSGSVHFLASRGFTMTQSDYADVALDVTVNNGNGNVSIAEVKGVFDPRIDPEVNTVEVASSLPDFLQEEGVRVVVANPTVKFVTDMAGVPMGVNMSVDMKAHKDGSAGFDKDVFFPNLPVEANQHNTVYYYQAGAPYDPETDAGTAATATAQVNNINALLEELPDYIEVDLSGEHIKVQDKEYTIRLGELYGATAHYKIYAPFEFNQGLTIVYKDSTESMGEDLEDYAAKGLRLTATAQNAIPLGLVLQIEAHDKDGHLIPGIKLSPANIAAGGDNAEQPTETEITVDADLDDPNDLKKLDTFVFRIEAASGEGAQSHKLLSTQYVRLADVRLRLKGAVTADFN